MIPTCQTTLPGGTKMMTKLHEKFHDCIPDIYFRGTVCHKNATYIIGRGGEGTNQLQIHIHTLMNTDVHRYLKILHDCIPDFNFEDNL